MIRTVWNKLKQLNDLMNNTLKLLLEGWSGLWIEGN
jgi:hypothetical protein